VALSGALAQLSAQADSSETPDVSTVNAYAYAAEVILHGSPSGADNTVAAFGGALVFQRRPEPSFRAVRCDLNRFRFLLVNTRVPRSTKEQVGNVRALFEADTATVQGHFDAIERIVRDFIALGESGTLTRSVLAQQVEENHRLLNLLGVGHPQIDEVARISRSRGGATKLTGAGGGGCTVTLLPTEMTDAEVAELVKELEAHGFECFSSSLGGDGFRIDP
jgi:mevalonate kinase